MIRDFKRDWFVRWFSGQVERRVRMGFSRVFVRGLDSLRGALAVGPVLVVSNHTSYWDPMLVMHLCCRILGCDAYAMMVAENLRRRPFLGRMGGFGFDPDDPRDGARAVRYAARLLDRPGRLVWIFPQGAERPSAEAVSGFRPGAALIARLAQRASVIPVGFDYEMGGLEKPMAFISVGPRLVADGPLDDDEVAMEMGVRDQLDLIDACLLGHSVAGEFSTVLVSRPSPWSRWAEALLSALTRLGYRDASRPSRILPPAAR